MEPDPARDSSDDLHAMADAEFGPCLVAGCPTSVFATTDLEALWAREIGCDD